MSFGRLRVSGGCATLLWFAILALGCSGGSNLELERLEVGGEPFLIQTSTGVWSPSGKRLSALGGSAFADQYVIDTSQPAFFFLSDGPGVYIGEREGDELVVRQILSEGTVVRPLGQSALVRRPDANGLVLVSPDGSVLREGIRMGCVIGRQDPPVDQREYWSLLDYWQRPAPVCLKLKGKQMAGWLREDGTLVAPPTVGKREPFVVDPVPTRRDTLVSADGTITTLVDPTGRSETRLGGFYDLGPLSDGVLIVSTDNLTDPHHPGRDWYILDADGSIRSSIEADLLYVNQCPGWAGSDGCMYAFQEGLAAVSLRRSPQQVDAGGYIGLDGTFKIGPDPCSGAAPSGPFVNGRAFHCIGSQYWLIDVEGKRLAGPWSAWPASRGDRNSYAGGLFFSEGHAAVPVENGFAYINTGGEQVLNGPFEVARPFRLGVARVKRDGVVSDIDLNGNVVFGG